MKAIFAVALLFVIAAISLAQTQTPEQAEIARLKAENAQLRAKVAELETKLKATAGKAKPTDTTNAPANAKTVTISSKDARDSFRVNLGPVKKGQTIMFQYVSGTWTDHVDNAPVGGSPDDVVLQRGAKRVRICERLMGSNNKPEVVLLAAIPGGTKDTPFAFTADHDIAALILNHPDDPNLTYNNVGSVVYRVWAVKPDNAK